MELIGATFVFLLNGGCAFFFAMAFMRFPTWEHDRGKVIIAIALASFIGFISIGSKNHDFECNKDYKGHCM